MRALKKKRRSLRKGGPKLSPKALIDLLDKLELLQMSFNRVLERQKPIVKRLLVHYAHTGESMLKGNLGEALIYPSFVVSLAETNLRRKRLLVPFLSLMQESRLIPEKVMHIGNTAPKNVQRLLARNARVSVRLTIVPANSRRRRSGKTKKRRK